MPRELSSDANYLGGAKNSHEDGEFLTDAQLGEMLHVDGRTTLRWRNTGDGPPFIRVGARRILYRRSEVDSWLAARTHQHRAGELAKQAA